MISKFALFGTFLLSSSALHLPSQAGAPLARRDENPQSLSLGHLGSRGIDPSHVVWNSMTAGSVLSGNPYDMITARVTVPRLTGADGTVVISVGLDGGCWSGSIGMAIQGRYTRGVSSWYASSQWSPAHPINFSLPIKTGDMIKFTVFAFSATVGVVIYENESTGLATAQEYTTDQPLCMYSAGWAVRGALDDMGQFLPLANFGTVDFVDAMAFASNTQTTDFPGGPSWYSIYAIRGRITPIQASGPTLTIKQTPSSKLK